MKDTEQEMKVYREFKQFLEDYFNGKLDDEIGSYSEPLVKKTPNSKKGKSSGSGLKKVLDESDFNEDGRAIPGGRYGCAQFVKVCGPDHLKTMSLGRLAQMVQRSINEDFLRY